MHAGEHRRAWPPDGEFWQHEFAAATKKNTAPALFKSLLPLDLLSADDVIDGLRRVRLAHGESQQSDARVRVYVGEDRRDDLVPEVLTAPWTDGTPFVSWAQKLVAADRFCMVINNLEITTPVLSAALAPFVASVFEHWGVPIGGCEQVAFVGNYSGTAFGVHEGYEDAFLVHLGPGTKYFYCWPPETYTGLAGTTAPTFGDYKWMLPHGECFVLEPGDVLFLPRRVYHVGVQDKFSVSVAVPLYTYPVDRLVARSILPDALEDFLEQSRNEPSDMNDLSTGAASFAQMTGLIAREILLGMAETIEAQVLPVVTRRWEALLSNGGWEIVPNDLARADATSSADEIDDLIIPGARLRLREPYRLREVSEPGASTSLTVFLRGSPTTLAESEHVRDAIQVLASGEPFELPALEAVLEACKLLYATGGLTC